VPKTTSKKRLVVFYFFTKTYGNLGKYKETANREKAIEKMTKIC